LKNKKADVFFWDTVYISSCMFKVEQGRMTSQVTWYCAKLWISIPIYANIEGWFVFSWLVNVRGLVILASYHHISLLQMCSTAAHLVRAQMDFYTPQCQTRWFLLV